MRRLSLHKRLTLNTVATYMALFCVVTFALLEHASISIDAVSRIKLPLMLLGAVCLLTQLQPIARALKKRNYFYAFLTLAVMSILLLWSMLLNWNATLGGSPAMRTVRLILYLLELFLVLMLFAENGKAQQVVNFLFWYSLILVLLNDALMFSGVVSFGSRKYETYLIGTKFNVAYLHMNLLVLWFMRSKRGLRRQRFIKLKVLTAAVCIVAICLRVEVVTGLVGCLVLVLLMALVETPKGRKLFRLASPTMLSLVMGISVAFVFVAVAVLDIPFVRTVVEEVFHRDVTLTGRVEIYQQFVENMQGHWLAGYGYGNGNAVSVALFGYENVQNGLLQWVLQVGVPATAALVALVLQVFKQISRRRVKNLAKILPLVALIYMYVILSMVETTVDMAFVMWTAVIFMFANERQTMPVPAEGLRGGMNGRAR